MSDQFARTVNERIARDLVKTPGADGPDSGCWVWCGRKQADNVPVVLAPNDRGTVSTLNVKKWLRQDPTIAGQVFIYATSCGVGQRCVNPEHNDAGRFVEATEYWQGVKRLRDKRRDEMKRRDAERAA